MKTGKKRIYGKKAISHRASFSSLTISKKNARASRTENHIEERWDTVYVSAKELRTSKTEIIQNMKSLRNIFGDF